MAKATAQEPRDNPAVDTTPVIYYSPIRYRIGIATGLLVAALLLTLGVADRQSVIAAEGIGVLLFAGLFTLGVKDKLRSATIALAREGDLLVGGELKRPLPVSETTFETVSDYEGSWGIILRSRDDTIGLRAGGWSVEGERFVTRAVAERILLALGLTRRTR